MTPTRNNIEPTTSVTNELRRLLDERGVEYRYEDVIEGTLFVVTRDVRIYYILAREKGFKVWSDWLTPEQAIAAALGSFNCTNSERTDETCLPHFWTHDGTLHVELPKLPESISVRLPDQRDREVGSARTWQFTRDRGTCRDAAGDGMSYFACSRCGGTDLSKNPTFCHWCGAKVVDA